MALVTVARFRDPINAELWKAALEDAGIHGFVADEQLISMQWLYSTAVGGVRLQVAAAHEEAAREVLGVDATASLDAAPESGLPPGDGDLCPDCQSTAIRPSHSKRSALALSLLFEFPLFVWRRRWVCEGCGHSWRMARRESEPLPSTTLNAEVTVQGRPGSYVGTALALAVLVALFTIQYVLRQPAQSW